MEHFVKVSNGSIIFTPEAENGVEYIDITDDILNLDPTNTFISIPGEEEDISIEGLFNIISEYSGDNYMAIDPWTGVVYLDPDQCLTELWKQWFSENMEVKQEIMDYIHDYGFKYEGNNMHAECILLALTDKITNTNSKKETPKMSNKNDETSKTVEVTKKIQFNADGDPIYETENVPIYQSDGIPKVSIQMTAYMPDITGEGANGGSLQVARQLNIDGKLSYRTIRQDNAPRVRTKLRMQDPNTREWESTKWGPSALENILVVKQDVDSDGKQILKRQPGRNEITLAADIETQDTIIALIAAWNEIHPANEKIYLDTAKMESLATE